MYCTCTQCTERFLQKRGIKPGNSSKKIPSGKARGEKVKAHPVDCTCATCNLLRSVDGLPPATERKLGLLPRLLRRK